MDKDKKKKKSRKHFLQEAINKRMEKNRKWKERHKNHINNFMRI